jgi:hypothetical protein
VSVRVAVPAETPVIEHFPCASVTALVQDTDPLEDATPTPERTSPVRRSVMARRTEPVEEVVGRRVIVTVVAVFSTSTTEAYPSS